VCDHALCQTGEHRRAARVDDGVRAHSLPVLLAALIAASGCLTASAPGAPPADASAPGPVTPTGKGVNYQTGNGMAVLAAAQSDSAQVARDLDQIAELHGTWVRIETYMPSADHPDTTANLPGLLDAITRRNLSPIVDILQWHYPATSADAYKTWLAGFVRGVARDVLVFEIGNEPNLNMYSESGGGTDPTTGAFVPPYAGFDIELHPYGWDLPEQLVDPAPGSSDGMYVGACPQGVDLTPYRSAVASYVQLLADSYAVIKAIRPSATVVLGGISSWQASCFLTTLGALHAYDHADALGWHAYPVGADGALTPQNGANTLDQIVEPIVTAWAKPLPIWITEYGFQSPNGFASVAMGNAVADETAKANDLAQQYQLMRTEKAFTGPIVMYSAVDAPVTAADWAAQDPSHGEGGFGLWEWCTQPDATHPCAVDGLKVNPSMTAFTELQ
jgi:hypothetical protein